MRSAVRHLIKNGVEALKPQRMETKAVELGNHFTAKASQSVWRRPVVSKRVANVIRKQAIHDGTYGIFDADTGLGWDPQWDLALYANQYSVTRFGGIQPSKKTIRERSRAERATKIQENLETRLEKMEEYYNQREGSRVQERGFEATFKRLKGSGTPGR